MDDLVAFLRARLDEDAEAARLAEAVDPGPWYEDVEDGTYTNQRSGLDGVGLVRAADNVGLWDREQSCTLSMAGATATHVARHDPARVLREVDAKQWLLNLCAAVMAGREATAFAPGNAWTIMTRMAEVYRDHPDWRPYWPGSG